MDRAGLLKFHEATSEKVIGALYGKGATALRRLKAAETFGVVTAEQFALTDMTEALREIASQVRDKGCADEKPCTEFMEAVVLFAAVMKMDSVEGGLADWIDDVAKRLAGQSREIMKAKNHDYAGGKEQSQPFANFQRTESLGITSTEQGFLVRLSDKLSRLATFTAGNQLKVKDEGVWDTLLDSWNYMVLFSAFCADKANRGGYAGKV